MLEKSGLIIYWQIAGTGIELRLFCPADDERLKEQYRATPELLTKIIDFLAKESCTDKLSSLSIQDPSVLSIEEVPTELQPFIAQVKVWKLFIDKYRPALCYCTADVSSEGFLLLKIRSGSLITTNPNDEDWVQEHNSYFRFDPVLQPPTVTDKLIYWEFLSDKVLVILHHQSSNKQIATRFNYLESFQKLKSEEAEAYHSSTEARKRNADEDAKKLEDIKSTALKNLLVS